VVARPLGAGQGNDRGRVPADAAAAANADRLGEGLVATLAAVATAALAAASAAATIGAAPASASVHNWVMTGWSIHLTNQVDPATTGHFFNTNTSYGTGPNSTGNPISDGYSTNGVLTYTSYAQFASDLQNKSVGADGYYINVTTPTIAQADQFLQEMQAAGY
jgi:hypothetical protein